MTKWILAKGVAARVVESQTDCSSVFRTSVQP